MWKSPCLIAASSFILFAVDAQSPSNRLLVKPGEQKEILAALRLEKEIQQKQLLAKPEPLVELKEDSSTTRINNQKPKKKYKPVACNPRPGNRLANSMSSILSK